MKFGGLPFHQYVFSRYLSDEKLTAAGDAEMQRLAPIVFGNGQPQLTQLPMFMLMSYAERLDPGAIYRARPFPKCEQRQLAVINWFFLFS